MFLQSIVCQSSSSWHFGTISCLRRYASSAALLWESQILNCRDVEQAVNSLSAPPGPFNLGNTAYLSQESTQDRQALYAQLVNSYKWTDKVCNFGIGSVFWQLFVATSASLYHNINMALLDDCFFFEGGCGEGEVYMLLVLQSVCCVITHVNMLIFGIFSLECNRVAWLMIGTLSPICSLTLNFTSTAFKHVSFDKNCLPLANFFVTGKSQQFQGYKFECRKE